MNHARDSYEMAALFQRGEETGFDFFFNKYYGPLLFFCSRMIGDEETSKDIVTDCFINTWENRFGLSGEKGIRSYLYQSVRNTSLNHLAHRKVVSRIEKGFAVFSDTKDDPIESNMIRAEVFRQVRETVDRLPASCAQIIKMMFFEEKSVAEIEAELKISKSTIKTQKLRGLSKLREFFNITNEQFLLNEKKRTINIANCQWPQRYLAHRFGLNTSSKMAGWSVRNYAISKVEKLKVQGNL